MVVIIIIIIITTTTTIIITTTKLTDLLFYKHFISFLFKCAHFFKTTFLYNKNKFNSYIQYLEVDNSKNNSIVN